MKKKHLYQLKTNLFIRLSLFIRFLGIFHTVSDKKRVIARCYLLFSFKSLPQCKMFTNIFISFYNIYNINSSENRLMLKPTCFLRAIIFAPFFAAQNYKNPPNNYHSRQALVSTVKLIVKQECHKIIVRCHHYTILQGKQNKILLLQKNINIMKE